MSVNYHAFQSRGCLFSDSEAVCAEWRDCFSGFDPSRIARILDLQYDDAYLFLSYFQHPYRLSLTDGVLEKKEDDPPTAVRTHHTFCAPGLDFLQDRPQNEHPDSPGWTSALYFNEAMAIYHLLFYTKDQPRIRGVWVPSTSLDGVVSRSSRMPDPLLSPFARTFSGKSGLLDLICQKAGGTKLDKGDVSWQFEAFPQVSLQLVFWDADEDFPAQVQVFVDEAVTDFLHYETVGCVVSDLLETLTRLLPSVS